MRVHGIGTVELSGPGAEQRALVQGEDRTRPAILILHGGPSMLCPGEATAERLPGETAPAVRWGRAADGARVPPDIKDWAARYVHGSNLIPVLSASAASRT